MDKSKYILEQTSCNLCGSTNSQVLFKIKGALLPVLFHVVKCKFCGLAYVNPRVKKEDAVNFYNEEYYKGSGIDSKFIGSHKEKENDSKLLVKSILENFVSTHSRNYKLLDVGGGEGLVSKYAKEFGFDPLLVELSDNAIIKAAENNIPYYKGEITDKYFDSHRGFYDVIVALEVIEHLYDPLSFIKKVYQLLKLGGVFIYTTGNFEETFFSGKKWKYMSVPEIHIHYFTPKTIKAYFKIAGFKHFIDPYKYYISNDLGTKILTKLMITDLNKDTKPKSIFEMFFYSFFFKYFKFVIGRRRLPFAVKK